MTKTAFLNALDVFDERLVKEFWSNVFVPDSISEDYDQCWLFVKGKDKYPRFTVARVPLQAHRYSYSLVKNNKTFPKSSVFICHSCDNTYCVNPNHLFAGDARANVKDMIYKGRGCLLKGEKHGRAVLSDEQIVKIKELIFSGKYTQKEIANMFNISRSHVGNLKTGIRRND